MELEVVPQRHVTHTQMGWPVVPDGLRRLLHWLHERYAGLPIYVTENGAAFDDQPSETGLVNDLPRITYLRDHIAAVGQALAEGVDVRGYFVWSLLDNLEWSYGFTKRFGIVRCDPETQHRTIKASGHWYARFIAEGRLDDAGGTSPECGVEVSS
jgi:beta-glucosidase